MLSRVNRPGLRVLTRHQCARSISGTHVRSQQTFNVLMLGAGPANFGTMEGPWNHSKRLEKLLGDRLRLVGVVERNFARATDHLERKRADPVVKGSYEETRVFGSLEEAAASLGEERIPRLIIDGLPPGTRGSTMPGCDTEARMATLFPDAAFLIEKPVSTAPLKEVQKVRELLRGRVVSVGYMLRYLQGVQEIKRQLHKHSLTPMLTLARYFVAYSYAADMYRNKTRQYWDTSMERGPIVTQGTHLVDLIRHVTPAFLPGSLHVNTVEHDDVSGKLSALKFDESAEIPVDHRIPRATNASWCTETGGLVNFSHGYLLHEGDYDCELIVMADGWKFALKDPYGVSPRLAIRSPDGPDEVETVFENDDCFEAELRTIIDVVEGRASQDAILSPYADAVETYKMASHHISL